MSELPEDYKTEKNFLSLKAPALQVEWVARPLIEQLISAALPKEEADRIYTRLCEVFKVRAGLRLSLLLQLMETDKKLHLFRVIVSVKILRQLYPDELGSGGGGGGRGLNKVADPLQTTLTRRR